MHNIVEAQMLKTQPNRKSQPKPQIRNGKTHVQKLPQIKFLFNQKLKMPNSKIV